jgi:MFS superfamily sulfate permease-like transporter
VLPARRAPLPPGRGLKQTGFETISVDSPAIDVRCSVQRKETMILRKLENSPEKMIPIAMAFIVVGLSLITIGISWPRISPPLPHAGTDWNDFFRGIIFGIAIVLEIAGVVIAAKAAARKRKAL